MTCCSKQLQIATVYCPCHCVSSSASYQVLIASCHMSVVNCHCNSQLRLCARASQLLLIEILFLFAPGSLGHSSNFVVWCTSDLAHVIGFTASGPQSALTDMLCCRSCDQGARMAAHSFNNGWLLLLLLLLLPYSSSRSYCCSSCSSSSISSFVLLLLLLM